MADTWDETNGGSLVAATVTTVTIAAIFVGLRFYTRIRIVRMLGPSDWAILLALIFSIGNTACTLHRTLLFYHSHSFTVPLTLRSYISLVSLNQSSGRLCEC